MRTEAFKPGDLPPAGYVAWHDWAAVQYAAGIRQTKCERCGLYATPQEFKAGWHKQCPMPANAEVTGAPHHKTNKE